MGCVLYDHYINYMNSGNLGFVVVMLNIVWEIANALTLWKFPRSFAVLFLIIFFLVLIVVEFVRSLLTGG